MPSLYSLAVALLLAIPDALAATVSGQCAASGVTSFLPLSTYGPALSYCSASYPVERTTFVVSTITTTSPVAPGRRAAATGKGNKALFSSLQTQPAASQSTICSCIETPSTTTYTITATTTVPAATCSLPSGVFIKSKNCRQPCGINATASYNPNSCQSHPDYTGDNAIWCDFPGQYFPNQKSNIVSLGTSNSSMDCLNTCLASNTVFQCAIVMFQNATGACAYQDGNYCQYGYCTDSSWDSMVNGTPDCSAAFGSD